jgi:flavin reductase (DIM6/NTAB) family NADH-FMN oxidoreductase RutF
MINDFDEVEVKSLADNLFQLLDDDWMLITAGNKSSFNTMTASWGSFGMLWQKPVATIFVRPHRFTYGFIESSPSFTLSFFTSKYKQILNYCGQKSGKDVDKVKETELTPLYLPTGNVAFSEARLILDCKKLYSDDLKSDRFISKELIHKHYPSHDFHKMYIAEITKCYLADELKRN